MNEQEELINEITGSFSLLRISHSTEELFRSLTEKINDLINNDFNQLIRVLYRIDVSEAKLKFLLKENKDTDAAKIIAQLIIERQLKKIKSRREFQQRDKNIDEEEKW